jgi:hypothetical protein
VTERLSQEQTNQITETQLFALMLIY